MRVLVTGSTGLLGGAIGERLAADGHEVVGLARGDGHPAGIAETVRADIGAPGLVDALAHVRPCDAVVHCAASRGGADSEIARTNRLGTEQVLALFREWRARRFVFLSGITVLGRPRTLPITEEHPADPPGAYLASKLHGEQLVAREPAGVSLRISAPVGPRMPPERMLATFVRRALARETLVVAGRGSRRQDYVHARDVAAAVGLALTRPTSPVLNVAAGRSISNLELARRCLAVLGSEATIEHEGEDPEEGVSWEVSIERARAELGWEPQHDLDGVIGELAGAHRLAAAGSESPASSE